MNIIMFVLFYLGIGALLLKGIRDGKIRPTKEGVLMYSVGLVVGLMLLMGRSDGVIPLFFLV